MVGKFLSLGVKNKTIIDISTSYPISSFRLSEKVHLGGGAFLDASLTGTPTRAEEGTLQAIVGGNKEEYERMLSILMLFCERTFYAGQSSTGNMIKIATNYLCIMYIALYSEIIPFVEQNGGNWEVLFDVVTNSVANSGMFQRIAPKVINDNYDVSFLMKHAIKDLRYVKHLCLDKGVPSLMLDSGLNMFYIAKAKYLK